MGDTPARIMDWITNDVDWMTKEVHPSSVRLAWHN